MAKAFLDDDFLLDSEAACRLYHDFAEGMPVFDYHCHLSPELIYRNPNFENPARIWLREDHYKWRAMRANGVPEEYITGSASDREKFRAWAETVPKTAGNPLYHWTHLELKNSFGISKLSLGPENADAIYERCEELLSRDKLRPRRILKDFNVKTVCTTDDPADSLEFHKKLAEEGTSDLQVLPTFRPDRLMAVEEGRAFTDYLEKLSVTAGENTDTYDGLLTALDKRHRFFHERGCRLSDHALRVPEYIKGTADEVKAVYKKGREGRSVSPDEAALFRTSMLLELGRMNARRGWAMQLHIGALRNVNSRMYRQVGPDAGFDTIADTPVIGPMARFLDALDSFGELPRIIFYNLHPRDTDALTALAGCFQEGLVPGKIQTGPAWWFNDTKEGMISQLTTLSNIGLLSRFIGMTTDSRSFLSFSRHEYFRRILANLIGGWAAKGEVPADYRYLGGIVQDICYNNAEAYFRFNHHDRDQ